MDREGNEVIYGSALSLTDDSHVMSERVQSLAASVYQEFERMIKKYDEDVVKELMPLVVGILEALDLSYTEKQENEVELELLRDDNEQLLTQYEREKQLRKGSEQKYLEVEDTVEIERRETQTKLESLESLVRMLELKARNSQDHVTRLEEKEAEMKKEYSKLHERYTELFRTHMDHMERAKMFMGSEKMLELGASPKSRVTFQMPVLRPVASNGIYSGGVTSDKHGITAASLDDLVSPRSQSSNTSLHHELNDLEKGEMEEMLDSKEQKEMKNKQTDTVEKEQNTDSVYTKSTSTGTTDALATGETDSSRLTSKHGKRRGNESSIFDELSLEDANALEDVDDGCDITGMSKEVENLILENTELLATKNALNVVKDDLIAKVDELTSEQEILREEITSLQTSKEKLRKRVTDLEDEIKKFREELDKEKSKKGAENEEEEEVPMAQRKRFTRVEMARVLMERNQYKERLMELQEAVRWTEMIRASRDHPDLVENKKKGSIWNFFSNLFNANAVAARPASKRSLQGTTVKYSAPTKKVTPQGDPNKNERDSLNLKEKGKPYDFLQDDFLQEKARKEREKERREQYKQVRAHVKKDDGRMQAYGWSLPAKFNPPVSKESSSKPVPVPVPIYCRPLLERDEGVKLWCAAGVNLTGGKTKDGGSIVGASVFYNDPPRQVSSSNMATLNDIDRLDQEIQDHKKGLEDLENENFSSLAWICTTVHNCSQVTVIDTNNPGDILETFHVTSSHILCIASVPGAMEDDYPSADSEPIKCDPVSDKRDETASTSSADGRQTDTDMSLTSIPIVQCVTGAASSASETAPGDSQTDEAAAASDEIQSYDPQSDVKITYATGSPASSNQSTPSHSSGSEKRHVLEQNELVKDGISDGPSSDNEIVSSEIEKMSSVLPTMWLGCQSGSLYVHSGVSQWKRCLHSVKLKDSILNIIHLKGRVFVSLADGSLVVFHREVDGQWNLKTYHIVELGKPQHSIRCLSVVGNKHIWCGYRNKIHVICPKSLKLKKTFDAHPRKESQVRQLAWVGDGVWVSIRLDSTLRLYHAYTHQHLQDVDIEPYVSKMLGTGKLGFSFVRITALLASCNRLWIGTGNGVIISVPLSETNKQSVTTAGIGRPGGIIRVYSDQKTDSITPGSFLPYCTMAQAQLSFHGHRDAVKFFVAVPGAPSNGVSGVMTDPPKENPSEPPVDPRSQQKKTMLVMSGGEGYIDFRIGDIEDEGDGEEQKKTISKGDKSHLIVWHMSGQW